MLIESGEFTQIIARNSHGPIIRAIKTFNDLFNHLKIISLLKKNDIFLPEFLSMTRTPSKLFTSNLVS